MGHHRGVFEPRDLALEAAIREQRGDPEGFRVLGDWLEESGYPRGRLIAVQAALADAGMEARRGELEREQAELSRRSATSRSSDRDRVAARVLGPRQCERGRRSFAIARITLGEVRAWHPPGFDAQVESPP